MATCGTADCEHRYAVRYMDDANRPRARARATTQAAQLPTDVASHPRLTLNIEEIRQRMRSAKDEVGSLIFAHSKVLPKGPNERTRNQLGAMRRIVGKRGR
jgi:hypothetical protein